MFSSEQIEELKNIFNSKPGYGTRLPDIKDVEDRTVFYLKSQDTYIEHIAFLGNWYKKVTNSSSQVVLEKV